MKYHGINPGPECPLYSVFLDDFATLETLALPSTWTMLFLAADASSVSTETLLRIARRLLDAGVIWICAWGPDCQRVHDLFDEAHIADRITRPDFVLMSTWHEDDSLEEGWRFFVATAFPLDQEIPTTSYVAVTIGRGDWAETVNAALSDLVAFINQSEDDPRS